MLHQETEDLTRLQRVFMYFTNQVFSQITQEHNSETKVIREAMQTLLQKVYPEVDSLAGPWLKVLNKVNPVKIKEEESEASKTAAEVQSKKEKLDKLIKSLYA